MIRFLRSQLEQRAPAVFNGIKAIRYRRRFRRAYAQHHADFRRKLFPDGTAIKVQSGPFMGMRYFDEIVWGSITPKWLGSYEAELQPIVREIMARSYGTVIDVGCAEGYYAVGLAVVIPAAKVFAFDTDFISRKQIRRLASLNGVTDRLQVRTLCSHLELETLSNNDTLVVCDIEGFEAQLLDPAKAPSLLRSDILVEIHESAGAPMQMEQLLRSRFENSHKIQRIAACGREPWVEDNLADLPTGIACEALLEATAEHRHSGWVWFWMRATRA